MATIAGWKAACAGLMLFATSAVALRAQTFTTLHIFDGTDRQEPYEAPLAQGTDGNLYGTTEGNPTNVAGTVFRMTPGGSLTTIYAFCAKAGCTDGENPRGGLVLGNNGSFYGTTEYGGANGLGTVFKITPGGKLTTLYSFCSEGSCADGINPWGLVLASDGNYYGTTAAGGSVDNCNPPGGCGTVFKITPNGALTTLHAFSASEGGLPLGGLVQASSGGLYGTTSSGGPNGSGTVFKITSNGTLTTIYNFCSQTNCADGRISYGTLIQSTDGNLYGTTTMNGANDGGTAFKLTLGGTLTTLYSFCAVTNCTDGLVPAAGLVQGTDGNFYGTTEYGGVGCGGFEGCGTVFVITSHRALSTLYSFCSQSDCSDGALPVAGLVQATNGKFYGTTFGNDVESGAPDGTVFSLSVGLGAFVRTQTASGKVGAAVTILGTNLKGATSVTFNGTSATFTVNSAGAAISTTVPAGATTGPVKVVTPHGTLSSNMNFRVTP